MERLDRWNSRTVAVVAAFLRFGPMGYSLNDIIVGLIVLVTSFCIAQAQPWQAGISGVLGFWLIIAAFIPDLVSGIGLYLNNIIVGLVIRVVGLVILAQANKLVHYGSVHEHPNFGNFGAE